MKPPTVTASYLADVLRAIGREFIADWEDGKRSSDLSIHALANVLNRVADRLEKESDHE